MHGCIHTLLEMSYTPPSVSECSPWIPRACTCIYSMIKKYDVNEIIKHQSVCVRKCICSIEAGAR